MITDSGLVALFVMVVFATLLSIGSLKVFIVFRQIVRGWFE